MALARWFNRDKDVCVCGLLCFVTALASLGFVMWQNAGPFTVCDDFDFQQIPFTIALHKQIERGGLFGWCWNLDLGTSAIQGFGFYELGSPFFWASMLFPADAFPYVVGWMYMIKYVVAGVAAHLFARRFVGRGVRDRRWVAVRLFRLPNDQPHVLSLPRRRGAVPLFCS